MDTGISMDTGINTARSIHEMTSIHRFPGYALTKRKIALFIEDVFFYLTERDTMITDFDRKKKRLSLPGIAAS
jgi:hypothetical protein